MEPEAQQVKSSIGHRIYFVLICGIALLIPFHNILPSPMLILTFLSILITGEYATKWKRITSNKRFLLFAAIYIPAVYGYFLSSNTTIAGHDLQVRLYALLIPIFFTLAGPLSKKELRRLLSCYVISSVLFALTAIVVAIWRYPDIGAQAFYYKELVSFTFIHPSYAAMFLVFAVMLVSAELVTRWEEITSGNRIIYILLMLLLSLIVLLLTAKLAIACLFIVISLAVFVWGKKNYNTTKAILILISLNIAMFIAMMMLPYTRERMQMLLHYKETSYSNSVDSREQIWHSAIQVASDHLIVGIGTGDAEDMLVSQYAANQFETGVQERYNCHNEYLQVLVDTGLPGLIFFLLVLTGCFRLAFIDKNYLWMAFLLLFAINIITENMLRTQSGIVFFSFFNALLGLHSGRKQAGV
ncbi:MAG TPA: O-antigen ligase family protein [Chitinophagales bacterium]|nr:O-antigen ligase family protein [Chitinophagales bacterium]HNA57145.1 O-antigen ligase family protein [Chitinophagales bacterium]HNE46736.1 O-antigen ligase family protein [Chitinophagales bacterium]HNF69059.1 O-antigen ligase family protein [Chitinophagales bacterium]HNI55868.1 O-antigen ligase family protein [Chitinophagales bacterium]